MGRWQGLRARAILVAGFAVFVAYAYPGLMTPGAFAQLRDARAGEVGDVLTALWWLTDRIVAGPFPLVAAQGGCFLAGAYLLARRVVPARTAAICAAVTLVIPPVLAGLAVVGEQGLFVGLAMLGAALIAGARVWVRVVGLALVSLAVALHRDGAIATAPIVLLLAERMRGELWRRAGIVLAIWFAVVGLGLLAGEARPENAADAVHVLGLDGPPPVVTRAAQSIPELQAAEIQHAHGAVQRISGRAIDALSGSFLFAPWLYLALAALAFRFAPRELGVRPLVVSGVAGQLALVISPRQLVYGDVLWLVATAWFAAVMLLAHRSSKT